LRITVAIFIEFLGASEDDECVTISEHSPVCFFCLFCIDKQQCWSPGKGLTAVEKLTHIWSQVKCAKAKWPKKGINSNFRR